MQPSVPINVDEETGIWTTDNLPMLYVPRHFFVNNHTAVEAALGREKYQEILYPAGHKSAYFWCDKESGQHGLKRSEEHTSELQSLMRISYAVFCLKKKRTIQKKHNTETSK